MVVGVILALLVFAVMRFLENPSGFMQLTIRVILVIVVFGVGFVILTYICEFLSFIGLGYNSAIGTILFLILTVLGIAIALCTLKGVFNAMDASSSSREDYTPMLYPEREKKSPAPKTKTPKSERKSKQGKRRRELLLRLIDLMKIAMQSKKNNNDIATKGKSTPVPKPNNIRAFIDSIYLDYDEQRGKPIANLFFNYKTEKGRMKIKKAVKAYTHNIRPKDVIFVFDTTVFGAADDGFLMTDKMICVHNAFESENHFLYYPQIKTIMLRKGQLTYDIWVNDGKNEVRIDTNLSSHEEAERLLGLVRLVWKTFKPAKDVHKAQEAEQGENAEKHEESTAIPMANPAINARQEDGSQQQQVEDSGKQMVKCPSCGAQNTDENKFCDEYGASMQPPPKEQRKCPECGASMEADEKFCTECGAPFETPKCCPNCGAEVKEGKKFCGKCGRKLM